MPKGGTIMAAMDAEHAPPAAAEMRSKHDRGLPPRPADLREMRRLEMAAMAAVADYKAAVNERRRLA